MTVKQTQNASNKPWRRWPFAIFALLAGLAVFSCVSLEAARRFSYEEDKSVVLREVLDSLEQLRHEVSNHETEIRMYEEKFKNQEDILDSIRQQITDTLKTVKEALKNQTSAVEARLASQETSAKGLTSELKSHATDSVAVLNEYKQRIQEIEKVVDIQNRNIENLQSALRSLSEVLQIKDNLAEKETVSSVNGSHAVYRVKAGDSLEKIAKQNNTTIKKIKELNNLTKDQIIIGQKLLLPE